MPVFEWLKAVLYGMVEGITEWLPVSSTGHLILFAQRLPFRFSQNPAFLEAYWELFEVVIQLGAVLAVVVLFFGRLFPFGKSNSRGEKQNALRLWGKVLLASVPAAVVGVFGDRLLEKMTGKDLDGWFYHAPVVAAMLILYGVAFLFLEGFRKRRNPKIETTGELSPRTAFCIGLFQVLSLIPGTSRSGSTILGALLLGVSRSAAAEFSFFLAVPVMLGAGGVKTVGFFEKMGEMGIAMPPQGWLLLLIGTLVSFLVSLLVIRLLTDFVKKHTLILFGVYRILLGAVVLIRYWAK